VGRLDSVRVTSAQMTLKIPSLES